MSRIFSDEISNATGGGRRRTLRLMGAGALAGLPAIVKAQSSDWPKRPIKLVVPVAPGGVYDAQARLVSERLTAVLGQSVVVENKPGAENRLGTAAVANAAPDGYTLLMCGSSMVQSLIFSRDNPYKLSQLTPLGMCCWLPIGFGINANVPAVTLSDFVRVAREKPGAYAFGSIALSTRAIGEFFKRAAGIDLTHVAYKGEAPLTTDLVAGHVQSGFMTSGGFKAWYGRSDKVRWLGVTTPRRLTRFPAVPTFVESGYSQIDMSAWLGFMAPAGTPREILSRLSNELESILRAQDVTDRILELGVEPHHLNAADFGAFLDGEMRKWQRVQKETGIEPT